MSPIYPSSTLILAKTSTLTQVSSAAFRAFSCERFDNGREFLRADYALECSTATHVSKEYDSVKNLAWLGILLYPVGISLVHALLFRRARRSILQDRPTPLSEALGFLVRDFEPGYFWWELLEAWKKLVCRYHSNLYQTSSFFA